MSILISLVTYLEGSIEALMLKSSVEKAILIDLYMNITRVSHTHWH